MGDDNVVLYYKPQGADDDKTGLKREDFLIVLQTPIQAEMFKKFAEGKVVCVDATHGTNAYDFKMSMGRDFQLPGAQQTRRTERY